MNINPDKVLEYINVSALYSDGQGVRDISFSAEPYGLYCISGPAGAGKSTVIKCLINSLKYKYGEILIGNNKVREMSARKLSSYISYIPPVDSAVIAFTAAQTVLTGITPSLAGFFPSKKDKHKAAEIMDSMGIKDIAKIPFRSLEQKGRQLVLIARAALQNAPVVAFDTSADIHDYRTRLAIWQSALDFAKAGKTVILASREPLDICTTGILMAGGRIVACAEPAVAFSHENLSYAFGIPDVNEKIHAYQNNMNHV